MKGIIEYISRPLAVEFLITRHYSNRIPSISYAFGWYIEKELVAVLTIGKPASPNLCVGVCGEKHSKNVYELNRLCRVDNLTEQLSAFVSACLRRLRSRNLIIISYADTAMSHNGYIYQACNFIYTGKTKERTDIMTDGNTHSRHYDKSKNTNERKIRSSKHRYIFFCTFDKKLKKEWLSLLSYKIENYPKGENKNYKLGKQFIQIKIVKNGETKTIDQQTSKTPIEMLVDGDAYEIHD